MSPGLRDRRVEGVAESGTQGRRVEAGSLEKARESGKQFIEASALRYTAEQRGKHEVAKGIFPADRANEKRGG